MSAIWTQFDLSMMARAIGLAKQGRFTTSPNPNVGCVLTQGTAIVGEGYHQQAGTPHAEVHAMRQAGQKTQGATAYVTLEPCSHYGRTPPCAKGLIDHGVQRVVCAMQDPNPQVAGRGIQMLRDAGVAVEVGLLEGDAQALNPGFIKRMTTGMPWVQLKMAASLDGQTALSNGASQWITSPQARRDVQRFRAQACAIISTAQTVCADNASLTVRAAELPDAVTDIYPDGSLRQPTRVILDRQHQLSPELALFQSGGPILTVAAQDATGAAPDADLYVPASRPGELDLTALLASLANQHQFHRLWVEAGARLAQSFLRHQLVDELVLYLAPKLMGSDGRGLFGAMGLTAMADVLSLELKDVRQVGPDLRLVLTPSYLS